MKVFLILLLTNLIPGCNRIDDVLPIVDDPDDPPPVTATSHAFYVATDGNDINPGTYEKPWASWQKAFTLAKAGDTIYIRGGVYYPDSQDENGVYVYRKSGTYAKRICIFNYPGEVPILDCSKISLSTGTTGIYMIRCNYIHLKGLSVRGARQPNQNSNSNGISIENSTGITFENCASYANGGSGYQAFESDSIFFINCDAYDNFDKLTAGYSGGQADGFVVCYFSSAAYTYFRGCRSWYNSDDGFDCWENEGIVVFDSCWAFNNGRGDGDGGGFKFGRTIKQALSVPQRVVTNCLAFNNRFIGFNQNNGNIRMTFYNNIAYDNDDLGFELSQYSNPITARNNISYKNGKAVSLSQYVTHDHNSWDASPSVSLSDADFASTDSVGVSAPRQSDGSLPVTSYLRLATGSDLINSGTNVGLPFLGTAPDMGPFEKQ